MRDYRALTARLDLPDPDDHHALAAAIKGGADVIVTGNVRDYLASRLAPYAHSAQHPDDFISDLFETDAAVVLAATGRHCAIRLDPRPINWLLSEALASAGRYRCRELARRISVLGQGAKREAVKQLIPCLSSTTAGTLNDIVDISGNRERCTVIP